MAWVRPKRRSCFQPITPYAPSTQTTTTTGRPRRVAVSISWTFIRKPPSPETVTARRSGWARAAAMAPGRPMPMVAKPLLMITVFGS